MPKTTRILILTIAASLLLLLPGAYAAAGKPDCPGNSCGSQDPQEPIPGQQCAELDSPQVMKYVFELTPGESRTLTVDHSEGYSEACADITAPAGDWTITLGEGAQGRINQVIVALRDAVPGDYWVFDDATDDKTFAALRKPAGGETLAVWEGVPESTEDWGGTVEAVDDPAAPLTLWTGYQGKDATYTIHVQLAG